MMAADERCGTRVSSVRDSRRVKLFAFGRMRRVVVGCTDGHSRQSRDSRDPHSLSRSGAPEKLTVCAPHIANTFRELDQLGLPEKIQCLVIVTIQLISN